MDGNAIPTAFARAAPPGFVVCRRTKRSQSEPCGDCDNRCGLVSAALDLANRGLRPTPMVTCEKRPALKGWQTRASHNPEQVEALFVRTPRADGLAIVTGDGLFVLDLDRNHAGGADGVKSFALLMAEHGGGETLAPGPRVVTPRNGLHIYFRCDPARKIRNRVGLARGVDLKGHGGLALAPPSPGYRWSSPLCTQDIPIAPLWLLGLVDRPAASSPVSSEPSAFRCPHIASDSAYSLAVLERELMAVANAKPGERNKALFKAAARLGSLAAAGDLPIEPVVISLIEAAVVSGLVADDGMSATRATIASGLKRGLHSSRSVPTPV